MAECKICCEKFNLKNHKKAVCPFCDFDVCRECVQTNLLNSVTDPKCMNCSRGWSRDVLDTSCTRVFRDGKYKQHRENLLLEREKCFMPAAIVEVEKIRKVQGINKIIEDSKEHIYRISRTIQALERDRNNIQTNNIAIEKREFVRKCPVTACRGFLSTRWKCEVCENNICKECNEINKDGHTCDPGNVETVKLLKKDTKPCPGCGEMIFKISGCSQMWCPSCHVAFDWNTMRIEKGRIHNPHFYEFNRLNNTIVREPGDIPCGGLPNSTEIQHKLWPRPHTAAGGRRYFTPPVATDPVSGLIYKIHQLVAHTQAYELVHIWRDVPNNDNLGLRVKYLMDEITEEHLKTLLQRLEKTREKTRDIRDILQMFCDVMSDIFRQFMINSIQSDDVVNTYEGLVKYTTESFKTIHKRYNCTTPIISESCQLISCNWKTVKKESIV